MRPVDQPGDVRAFYRDDAVVREYLDRRTAQPFNGFLHTSQVRFLNGVLRQRQPGRVLEIAPGPARLTTELDLRVPIVALDASTEMLRLARQRLSAAHRPHALLQGDAFRLPFADHSFDFVFVLKLIRHFQLDDRLRLYGEIRRVLDPAGTFVLDAQNRAVSLPHRIERGAERYRVYDALYDAGELIHELHAAGFRVVRLDGIACHFPLQRRLNRLRHIGLAAVARHLIGLIERVPGGAPSTWMVLTETRTR